MRTNYHAETIIEQAEKKYGKDAIAIVGVGCRFPGGVTDTESFWEMVKNGTDAITVVPEDRWSTKLYYNKKREFSGKTVSKWGGFIKDVDKFDPHFFGITPREAPFIDPQQRILLESTWEAFEDAGLRLSDYSGKDVGVFIGAFTLDYKILQFGVSNYDLIDLHTATGCMMTMISNRISYAYNFTGPSMSVDTACSSSLVSLHYACRSILNNECSTAVAGGVLLHLTPQYTIAESRGGFLSEDGNCKTFDSSANGYVRGEGVGVVVLKRLSDALRSNDPIHSVILASGVNQDGHTSAITVPNGNSQTELIRSTINNAGITPKDIQYIEMHGTGTFVGDPIEVNAIGSVMGDCERTAPCVVSSVKANIGHLEAASGVASIIKASLCLEHKQIPPQIKVKEINPKLDLEKLNVMIPNTLMDWPEHDGLAIAGVNGFGFGGTNAHIVLAEAPAAEKADNSDMDDAFKLFPVSARSEEALREQVTRLRQCFAGAQSNVSAYDVAHSLYSRRDQHDFRAVFTGRSVDDFCASMDSYLVGEKGTSFATGKKKKRSSKGLAFIFTGMGPQWWKMGRELYAGEPVFRAELERVDAELRKYTGWSIIEHMLRDEEHSEMSKTVIAQIANFALQLSLTALWKSFGVEPSVILGHSAGEVAAFYEAGVLSFEDAVKVIYYRSSLQNRLAGKGSMLAAGISGSYARELISHYNDVDIVAINSDSDVTLAGERAELELIEKQLSEEKLFCKFLQVDVPFHSHYMEEIKDEFLAGIKDVRFLLPKESVRLFSSVTGKEVTEILTIDYLWHNIRNSVLFSDATKELISKKYNAFLEIGPHPALSHYIRKLSQDRGEAANLFSSLNRKIPEKTNFYTALAGLYANGIIDSLNCMFPKRGNFVRLPHYAWQRESYWMEAEEARRKRLGIIDSPLLGLRQSSVTPTWELDVNEETVPFVEDHKIGGNTVVPAALYVEMAFEAAKTFYGNAFFHLKDIQLVSASFVAPNAPTRLHTIINEDDYSFSIHKVSAKGTELAVKGLYSIEQNTGKSKKIALSEYDSFKSDASHYEKDDIYSRLGQMGYGYQGMFRSISDLYIKDNTVMANITVPEESLALPEECLIHPGLLDCCFQTMISLGFDKTASEDILLPVAIGSVRVYRKCRSEMVSICTPVFRDDIRQISDIVLCDQEGAVIAEIGGFMVQDISKNTKLSEKAMDSRIYDVEWVEMPLNQPDPSGKKGRILLLCDNTGVGESLAGKLWDAGFDTASIFCGECAGEGRVSVPVNCTDEEFNNAYLQVRGDTSFTAVVHLWNIDLPRNSQINEQNLLLSGDVVYSLVNTVKSIIAENEKPKLWVVTQSALQLSENDDGNVLQNSVWGASRVIANQEFVGLMGGIVDLDGACPESSMDMLVADILAEDEEDQIAYRDGRRYVARVYSQKLAKAFPVRLDPNGVYLVTGAFGSLGKLVCRRLVKNGARKLLVVGRSSIPEKSDWDNAQLDDRTKSRIDFLRELNAADCETEIAIIDMKNCDDVHDYFTNHADIYRSIKGIVSTAGIIDDRLLYQMPKESFDSVYNTKVLGNWNLHALFKTDSLDFFIMFSSIAGIITSAGQVNYSSANAFLDGLSKYRRNCGYPTLSVAWGPWAEGMIKDHNLEELYIGKGMTPIQAESGMQIMDRLIGQDTPYAIVVEADWDKLNATSPRNKTPYLDHLRSNYGDESVVVLSDDEMRRQFIQEYIQTEESARPGFVKAKLCQILSVVFHVKEEAIDMERSLNEQGADSMLATELKNRIELLMGINISMVDLLNNTSINELVTSINQQLGKMPELKTVDELIEETSEETIGEMLSMLENLSDEEIAAMMQELTV